MIEGLEITWRRVPEALSKSTMAWSYGLSAAVSANIHIMAGSFIHESPLDTDRHVHVSYSGTEFAHDNSRIG